jgi:hypothetical protein
VNNIRRSRIRTDLAGKYNEYYSYWRDFYMLTCMLAIFGLGMAYTDYNSVFGVRTNSDAEGRAARKVWREEIVMINFLTVLTILACFFK